MTMSSPDPGKDETQRSLHSVWFGRRRQGTRVNWTGTTTGSLPGVLPCPNLTVPDKMFLEPASFRLKSTLDFALIENLAAPAEADRLVTGFRPLYWG